MRMTIFVAILLSALGAHAQASEREVLRVAAAVERALAAGQPSQARRLLSSSLSKHPGEAILLARYAALLLPLSQPAHSDRAALEPTRAAHELLRRVERARAVSGAQLATRDPESERQIALHVALAEGLLGQFERAFQELADAARLQDPSTVLCLRRLAVTALQQERLIVAEQALGLARQYMPQDRELPGELGRVLLARGKAEVAITVLSEALSAAPGSLSARGDLAYALAAAGRASEGLSLLQGVTSECLRERACALLAARIALECDRPREAVAFATGWAEQRDLDALFVLADAQLRAGDPAAARTAYERVLSVRPESVRARQGLEQLAGPYSAP